jgi:hypothetical protein
MLEGFPAAVVSITSRKIEMSSPFRADSYFNFVLLLFRAFGAVARKSQDQNDDCVYGYAAPKSV